MIGSLVRHRLSLGLALAAFLLVSGPVWGESPRVLAPGKVPSDRRLGPLKTLNGHFQFRVPDTAGEWFTRAEQLRQRVLVSTGLWPLPDKTPLNAVIHGKVEREGFTVERVYFESLPGHFVTGLLFRPTNSDAGRHAAVLSPHGHGGRQQTHSDAEIKRQLANGGEHFQGSGSMPKIARCAQLARMGCVTFIFDMLGYADSVQISRALGHRHQNPRPEELQRSEDGRWVLYSIDADLRLQSVMGLQTWNAIRALDFLASLPDVDPERLAVTGGSGGGTQSILLGAIDSRIKVSFPNGMVSTSMQGGCYCENCNYLRVGTGNVELAALFAPRPQAMTAADDWTKDMMSDGYPELQLLYAMIGEESDVYCRPMLNFKHNYNYVTRATMYQWMNRHLQLGLDDPVIESDFPPLSDEETSVWNDQHPAPTEVGPEHERVVCRWLDDQSNARLLDLPLDSKEQVQDFVSQMQAAWRILLDVPSRMNVKYEKLGEQRRRGLAIESGLLTESIRGSALPMLTVRGSDADPSKIVIWTDGAGKSSAFEKATGQPTDRLVSLASRATVILPDLLGQGEFNRGESVVRKQRLIDDKRSYSAFTFGYNRTLFAQRVGDLLSVIRHAHGRENATVRILSTSDSAPWASGAISAVGDGVVDRALIESNGFRFGKVGSYADSHFVPGAVKYGDFPGLLSLCHGEVKVLGESSLWERAQEVRAKTGKGALQILDESHPVDESITWLVQ